MPKLNPPVADPDTITVRLPIAFQRRGGRKALITPDGSPAFVSTRTGDDSALVKAIARAFRWRKLIEIGTHTSIQEIAAAEKINSSYVGRVLRLTLLAPEIVEAILDGRQPSTLQLDVLLKPFLVEWQAQRDAFGLKT